MPKFSRYFNEQIMNDWIAEGRGQGTGKYYKSWLTCQDGPPGDLLELPSAKLERNVTLFGPNEPLCFYLFEWRLKSLWLRMPIVDIYDQVPLLPRSETIEIAAQCGYEHPVHPESKEPIVLTSDFCYMVAWGGRTRKIIRTVKTVEDLFQQRKRDKGYRTLEKLEIERLYWLRHNVEDWQILTPEKIPLVFAKNAGNLRCYYNISDLLPDLKLQDFRAIAITLTKMLSEGVVPLDEAAHQCNRLMGFINHPGNTSLMVAYNFITTGVWEIDMYTEFSSAKPLLIQKFVPERLSMGKKS